MIARQALLGVVIVLAGCASAPIQWAPANDYALAIADNPAQQRFDLVLSSKSTVALCFSRESWPAARALPPGFAGATLQTAGGTKNLLPTGSAYCPGGCGELRIEPGKTLAGAIPYAAFGDAEAIAAEPTRSLTFEPHPFVCPK